MPPKKNRGMEAIFIICMLWKIKGKNLPFKKIRPVCISLAKVARPLSKKFDEWSAIYIQEVIILRVHLKEAERIQFFFRKTWRQWLIIYYSRLYSWWNGDVKPLSNFDKSGMLPDSSECFRSQFGRDVLFANVNKENPKTL